MAQQIACKECGWACRSCDDEGLLQLHVEVENLKQQLLEREHHIRNMETSFLAEADKFPNGEAAALTEELLTWQDKYSRLYESYKRVQKVNQNLEDKLLRIVDKCETEKNELLKEVSSLTQRLIDSRTKVNRLQGENERYKSDVSLAIQLLQCKPTNFVPQKYDSLPADLQQKVLAYVCGRRRTSDVGAVPIRVEMRTIKVPVSTSPPSSMLYPVNEAHSKGDQSAEEGNEEVKESMNEDDASSLESHPPLDNVSAAIMAKVLEERERERRQTRHCESCSCFTSIGIRVDSSSQTLITDLEPTTTCLNGYAATTRGSQGHVRFVDSLSRCSSGTPQINLSSRLGIKISDKSSKCDMPLITFDTSTEEKPHENAGNLSSLIDLKSDLSNDKVESRQENHLDLEGLKLDFNISSNQAKEKDKSKHISVSSSNGRNKVGTTEKLQGGDYVININSLPSVSCETSSKSSKEESIVAFDISSNTKSFPENNNRGKDISVTKGSDVSNSVLKSHRATNSQSIHSKGSSREVRNLTSSDSNTIAKSPSSWVRLPSETAKKSTLVVSSDKTLSPSVRPEGGSAGRVSFPSVALRGAGRGSENSPGSGPRFCSMRLQAGTSNILLDNATSYEPVLYTSRHTQDGVESWGVSASRSGAAVLVHAPRSRAPSTEEASQQQSKVALWVHANPTQTGT